MKLPHSPRSLWLSNQPTHELPPLGSDAIVDVAIVGAGMTGLTAALHLRRAGKSVLVLDAHRVAEGASGTSTGHLTECLSTRYARLERDFGEDGARLAAESCRVAIHDIEDITRTVSIPCGFERVPGFLYTELADASELEAERDAATRAGVDVSLTKEPPLAFARAALRFEAQAQIHPREYLVGLTRHLVANGVRIFERTRCIHVHERARNRVITDRGVIHASHVVYATNTPPIRATFDAQLARCQSHVVAFAAQRPVPEALFRDTATPYHTIRTQRVGDATLVLLGGECHESASEVDVADRYELLAEVANERFGVESIHFAWASDEVATPDGLPCIGLTPHSNSTYVATGFAGNGLTFGALAGRILTDAILGRPNRYAKLYSPARAVTRAPAASGSEVNAVCSPRAPVPPPRGRR
jgi:glycine/D-amino acid oxidase-like deaminating enzyme